MMYTVVKVCHCIFSLVKIKNFSINKLIISMSGHLNSRCSAHLSQIIKVQSF